MKTLIALLIPFISSAQLFVAAEVGTIQRDGALNFAIDYDFGKYRAKASYFMTQGDVNYQAIGVYGVADPMKNSKLTPVVLIGTQFGGTGAEFSTGAELHYTFERAGLYATYIYTINRGGFIGVGLRGQLTSVCKCFDKYKR